MFVSSLYSCLRIEIPNFTEFYTNQNTHTHLAKMLMQEKLYDFSSDYRPSSVGDYSPVVVAAAVNLCRNTSSPRSHLNSYECSKYMPLYYSSKIFSEYSQLLAKPSSLLTSNTTVPYLTMQLPIRAPALPRNLPVERITVTNSSSPIANNGFKSLPVKRALDGSVKPVSEATAPPCENHRTQSVIMKVEDQRIVEVPTNELIGRNAPETEEEIYICKWTNCYRWVDVLLHRNPFMIQMCESLLKRWQFDRKRNYTIVVVFFSFVFNFSSNSNSTFWIKFWIKFLISFSILIFHLWQFCLFVFLYLLQKIWNAWEFSLSCNNRPCNCIHHWPVLLPLGKVFTFRSRF